MVPWVMERDSRLGGGRLQGNVPGVPANTSQGGGKKPDQAGLALSIHSVAR